MTIYLSTHATIRSRDLIVLGALLGLGIVQAEIGRQAERLRRQLTDTPHINLTSVWTFAGVLLLPPPLVGVLVVVLYLQLNLRSWYRDREIPFSRVLANICFVTAACYVARAALRLFDVPNIRSGVTDSAIGVLAVVVALACYFVAAALLLAPLILARARSVEAVVGTWADNFLEVSTLCLGVVVAVVLAATPALGIAILPPLVILHRGLLSRQLETTATLDHKTGVLNSASWHYVADRELALAAQRPDAVLSVLMIDLDRFKTINDRFGHLAGDGVLRAVANTIAAEVREQDLVGRFGGEEFIVILPRAGEAEACKIGERIRAAVTGIAARAAELDVQTPITELSVSVGVSVYPTGGVTIAELTHTADAALYRAKDEGRNRVVSHVAAA